MRRGLPRRRWCLPRERGEGAGRAYLKPQLSAPLDSIGDSTTSRRKIQGEWQVRPRARCLSPQVALARSSLPWFFTSFPSLITTFSPQFPPFPGSSPLPRRNPATVRGLTRPPLLKVIISVVLEIPLTLFLFVSFSLFGLLMLAVHGLRLQVTRPQPCALRRFAPARVRKCEAASGHGRQELRTSEYQFDDDEPLWLAVVRDIAV